MMLSLTAKDTQLGFYTMEKIVLHGNGVDTMHFATLKMNRLWERRIEFLLSNSETSTSAGVTPKRSKLERTKEDQNLLRFQSDEEAVNLVLRSTTEFANLDSFFYRDLTSSVACLLHALFACRKWCLRFGYLLPYLEVMTKTRDTRCWMNALYHV